MADRTYLNPEHARWPVLPSCVITEQGQDQGRARPACQTGTSLRGAQTRSTNLR